jgi:rubrerythrin
MPKTDENLADAFAGESQANRKYLAFAKKADQEGYPQIAKLFRAAADAETVHAHLHLGVMGGIKSTKDNLKTAIDGEGFEFKKMYPEYIEQAKDDGNTGAARGFGLANQVEKIHHDLYSKKLEDLEAGRTPESKEYYVCQICGNTVENEAPDRCPICGAPKEKFLKID